jgi:hypothetical protein
MLDAARVDACLCECVVAGLQLVIAQPGESRFAVDDLILSQERDAGVVDMYRETSQSGHQFLA